VLKEEPSSSFTTIWPDWGLTDRLRLMTLWSDSIKRYCMSFIRSLSVKRSTKI